MTFAVYSFDKLGGSAEDLQNAPERAWLQGKPILPIAILAYLASIGLVYQSMPAAIFYIPLPGLFGAIYTARLPGIGRPKDIFIMKNILVGLATAACHVGLVGAGWKLFGFVFLTAFVDTALFDIRDIEGDRLAGVRTLPVVMGIDPALLCLAAVIGVALFIYPAGWHIAAWGFGLLAIFRKRMEAWLYDLLIEPWWVWAWILFQIPSWGMWAR